MVSFATDTIISEGEEFLILIASGHKEGIGNEMAMGKATVATATTIKSL